MRVGIWKSKIRAIGALAVFVVLSALALLWSCSHRQGEAEKQIMFAPKAYYDPPTDLDVYVAGTLTGDAVLYKNNTTAITCYKDRMECLTYGVEQIGANQVGRLDSPTSYPITIWDQREIIAVSDGDCTRETINIERKSEVVIWVVEPINKSRAECKNANDPVRRWTIEDPPAWKALYESIKKNR